MAVKIPRGSRAASLAVATYILSLGNLLSFPSHRGAGDQSAGPARGPFVKIGGGVGAEAPSMNHILQVGVGMHLSGWAGRMVAKMGLPWEQTKTHARTAYTLTSRIDHHAAESKISAFLVKAALASWQVHGRDVPT